MKIKKEIFFLFLVIIVFLFCFFILGPESSPDSKIGNDRFIFPFLSCFLIGLGFFLPKIKRNHFIGIRTPWTYRSREVWKETHKFGRKIFIIAGFFSFGSLFFREWAVYFFLTVVLWAAICPVIYSYFISLEISKASGENEKKN